MMITLDQARRLLADKARPLAPVTAPLVSALGCRLVQSPVSDVNLPPSDVSAMDGYAARAADLEVGEALSVSVEVPAGAAPSELPPGTVARIFTGAPVPAGSDTVVPQEQAAVGDDGRVVLERLSAGAHIRHRGEVVALGAELAPQGATVTPAMVSLLAACGSIQVEVAPRPRLSVVVTGAELVDAGDVPGPGQIRDSNGPLLEALAAASGLHIVSARRAEDSMEALRVAISTALEAADLVLTTGGVSVGDFDLVPDVVKALGGEIVFHRVRIKPGKPVLAAKIGEKWLIGLPGNPLAVLTGWRLFAWPLACALAGNGKALTEAPTPVALDAPAATPKSRTELRPAILSATNGLIRAEVLEWQGSHDVWTAARGQCLVRLEPGVSYPAGAMVSWYGLPDGACLQVAGDGDE